MAKKNSSSRSASQKSPKQPSKKSSSGLPMAIIVVGVAASVGIVMYLSSGEAEPVATTLDAPPATVDMAGGGHTRGPANPALTLVEFGDYECPHCMSYHVIMTEIMRMMPDELALEFHHYPIPVGPNSVTAARAAEAAGEQGRYWEMHDRLFETQREWTGRSNAADMFATMAGQLGLDTEKFRQDMESEEILERVLSDRIRGSSLGVSGTPTFFVDGRQVGISENPVEAVAQLRALIGR